MFKIMKEIKSTEEYLSHNKVFNYSEYEYATTKNNIATTPITEEILLEMSGILQKESMRKLVREVLEVIEKNHITELLVYNS